MSFQGILSPLRNTQTAGTENGREPLARGWQQWVALATEVCQSDYNLWSISIIGGVCRDSYSNNYQSEAFPRQLESFFLLHSCGRRKKWVSVYSMTWLVGLCYLYRHFNCCMWWFHYVLVLQASVCVQSPQAGPHTHTLPFFPPPISCIFAKINI